MFRIGIDTGGTFTDVVALDETTGEIFTTKTPTTVHDPSIGVIEGIEKALDLAGRAALTSVFHGTTVATNALPRIWTVSKRSRARRFVAKASPKTSCSFSARRISGIAAKPGKSASTCPQARSMMRRPAAEIVTRFRDAHEKRFGYSYRDVQDSGPGRHVVEWVNLRVTGIGPIRRPRIPERPMGDGRVERARTGRRSVRFDGQSIECSVYSRDRLEPGDLITEPAIVEEYGATTVIFPGLRWRSIASPTCC